MITLTENEQAGLRKMQEKLGVIFTNTGKLFLQKSILEEELSKIDKALGEQKAELNSALREQEQLHNGLLEKYGEGMIDPIAGTFEPEN